MAPSGPITVGDTVTIDVAISGASDLYGYQFDLNFDPALLSVGASTEGALLSAGGATFFVSGSIGSGQIAATADTLLTATSGENGDGILASLSFTAIGVGSSALSLDGVLLLDSALNLVDGSSRGAALTIVPTNNTVPEPASLAILALALH